MFFLISSTTSLILSLSESLLEVPFDEATLTGFNIGNVIASVHLIDANFQSVVDCEILARTAKLLERKL